MQTQRGALSGINVLDMGTGGVGPWAASLLAMMGANVIKIQPPSGDLLRIMPPLMQGSPTAYAFWYKMCFDCQKAGCGKSAAGSPTYASTEPVACFSGVVPLPPSPPLDTNVLKGQERQIRQRFPGNGAN